ncbi:hypothetical protein BST95_08640 [Halioglobus japonicus]|uniref:Uncharacterized protein n=1 Tax=Halioglobus japonicus TaxID=930805 RepID=A0AAP8MEF1_9GAMM|nr:hypothetical protein [Halioglobus japonicus]AQA18286.1 hypothetical protein BST95_08640 [Halioglobus japonicus]PLW86301.1 hypothetical protein C0029_07685 [Halioglobus japonicus]GHD13535.1 hypothetical protein GCM10007052_15900 [Halioglobus japonicus]
MNANFKPLGLAAAVATATAGYAGVANAQSYASATELGDLAIVPYYTVLEGYATGVNIINTANQTQVIKFRFRRATDSMDALDFNVVLSPYDMYTGFLSAAGDDITWTSNDNSCTVPAMNGNTFTMPGIYRADADTGYIEIISMGSPEDEDMNLAVNALHDSDGIPEDCDAVRENFFDMEGEDYGNVNHFTTMDNSTPSATNDPVTTYVASPDSLKVSYFIKSDETGVEFGDNAVHVAGFLDTPAMTNQEKGIFSGDLSGFDYPDLNGGVPLTDPASRGKYNELRGILAAEQLINDWSKNSAGDFTVDTDWVITYPGQYAMLSLPTYLTSLVDEDVDCKRTSDLTLGTAAPCDFRDIPMTAAITVYDREEQGIVVEDGELVVSPQPPIDTPTLELPYEVNVIQWGETPVLNAPVAITGLATPPGAVFGWASLETEPADGMLMVCDWNLAAFAPGSTEDPYTCGAAEGDAAVVGFVAWQRAFASLPAANYGRIVEHSRVQSAS